MNFIRRLFSSWCPRIKVKLKPGATLPARKTSEAAGYDLVAHSFDRMRSTATIYPWNGRSVLLAPGDKVFILCGVSLEMPPGWEAQIRGRSSLNMIPFITQLGTIDSDFRGEIGAIIINASRENQTISLGDRVAQIVICRKADPSFELVDELSPSERGTGGFGSTGR